MVIWCIGKISGAFTVGMIDEVCGWLKRYVWTSEGGEWEIEIGIGKAMEVGTKCEWDNTGAIWKDGGEGTRERTGGCIIGKDGNIWVRKWLKSSKDKVEVPLADFKEKTFSSNVTCLLV